MEALGASNLFLCDIAKSSQTRFWLRTILCPKLAHPRLLIVGGRLKPVSLCPVANLPGLEEQSHKQVWSWVVGPANTGIEDMGGSEKSHFMQKEIQRLARTVDMGIGVAATVKTAAHRDFSNAAGMVMLQDKGLLSISRSFCICHTSTMSLNRVRWEVSADKIWIAFGNNSPTNLDVMCSGGIWIVALMFDVSPHLMPGCKHSFPHHSIHLLERTWEGRSADRSPTRVLLPRSGLPRTFARPEAPRPHLVLLPHHSQQPCLLYRR